MQDGVLHAVQSRPHLLYRPDGALLRGLLGAVHGNRAFDKDASLYGILEGCTQQPMNLVDRRAGKKPLLLLFGQFLLLSLDIRTAGRFAQGRVEVFHVVGLKFLHLHAADIGDNKVLDGGTVASLSSCPVEPCIEIVLRDADASAYSQDTEFGGAVAQVVGRAQANGQHSCDLFHRVHQLCGCRAVSQRLDGIGLSDHLHCSGIRVFLQGLIRIIFEFHSFGHVRPIQIHRQASNSL